MRLRALVLFVCAIALLGAVAPAAHAQTGATCAASAGVTLSPGISMKGSSGTFTSVPGGTFVCVGVVKGTPVAGPGKALTFSGTYGPGDTCAQGKGSGKISAKLAKVGGGTMSVSGTLTITRVGSDVIVQGKLAGATLAADLQFVPQQGQDCVKTKVTRATVTGTAISIG
jgi:hypothetical protein